MWQNLATSDLEYLLLVSNYNNCRLKVQSSFNFVIPETYYCSSLLGKLATVNLQEVLRKFDSALYVLTVCTIIVIWDPI